MRIALAQGMHTDMPVQHLGEVLVQRCRKIWWTIYVLDRQMTSLMGLPQSIQDNQIHPQLPSFPGSPQKVVALSMQIRMCQIIAEINSSMYCPTVQSPVSKLCSCIRSGRTPESEVPSQNQSGPGQYDRPRGRSTEIF